MRIVDSIMRFRLAQKSVTLVDQKTVVLSSDPFSMKCMRKQKNHIAFGYRCIIDHIDFTVGVLYTNRTTKPFLLPLEQPTHQREREREREFITSIIQCQNSLEDGDDGEAELHHLPYRAEGEASVRLRVGRRCPASCSSKFGRAGLVVHLRNVIIADMAAGVKFDVAMKLPQLQNLIKRDPDGYRDDFLLQYRWALPSVLLFFYSFL